MLFPLLNKIAVAVSAELTLAGSRSSEGGSGDYNYLEEAEPKPPPGLSEFAPTWIGWGYWIAGLIAVFGLVAGGVQMMIGRFTSRSGVASDGLRQGVSTIIGCFVVAMAVAIARGILGG